MISIDDALACYHDVVAPLDTVAMPINDALGQVLVAPAPAVVDLPAFTQTAVDGYAVRAADTGTATRDHPVYLAISGAIAAGPQDDRAPLEAGQCMRILTGAPLPPDADAVIRQERVRRGEGHIKIEAPVAPGEDLRFQAEELSRGTELGRPGRRLTPGVLAALAMAGVASVAVRRRPRISVFITGDEIVPAGRTPRPGEVYDANGPLIRAWLLQNGYAAPTLHYVRDDASSVQVALDTAFKHSDLIITTGGVSVGDRDYVPGVAERLGADPLFWKVAQKPGKPLYFARRDHTFLLGLPGNPAAVLIGLVLHARCVLDLSEGMATPGPSLYQGRLAEAVIPDARRTRLIRARVECTGDGVRLYPLPRQGSHMLSNLQTADALILIPDGEGVLEPGSPVEWITL